MPLGTKVKISPNREERQLQSLNKSYFTKPEKSILCLLIELATMFNVFFISGKSQILFAVVFTSRYLDLFTSFISLYNTVMKLFFLATAYGTLYLMYLKFKATYDSNHDTFRY